MEYKHANVKFNNGNGALLCHTCRTILAYGFDHEDKEHYCPKCALDELAKQAQELGVE
jgi:Zn finger protein HypA/HybF involved in hydrogenase expression